MLRKPTKLNGVSRWGKKREGDHDRREKGDCRWKQTIKVRSGLFKRDK
jgi:hypothetical protein